MSALCSHKKLSCRKETVQLLRGPVLGWPRGVYTIQALEQMFHGKSWGKHFSQSWEMLNK